MKPLKSIFVFSLLICQISCQKNIVHGTWYLCNKDGTYYEYKITDHYLIMLSKNSNRLDIYKTKDIENGIIVSDFDSTEIRLLINNDTLKLISKSKDQIVLKSTYTYFKYEFQKADFKIDEIDSLNLESWKNKTLSEFKKRAELANCSDLRTEEEKIIPTLQLDDSEDEEIPIIEIEKK